MTLGRARVCTAVAAVALVVGGCSKDASDKDTSSATPSSASSSNVPCGEKCSDKEVTETGCDENAGDAIPDQQITIGGARGALSLRKSNPGVCTRIYWARFDPADDNTTAFKVIVKVTVRKPSHTMDQPSEPGNPAETAWTEGVFGKKGAIVEACLTAGGETECLKPTHVV